MSGLASACFTQAFGCVFLGEPRSEEAARANDAGTAMQWTMGALAAVLWRRGADRSAWPFVFRSAIVSVVPRDCAAAVRHDRWKCVCSAGGDCCGLLGAGGDRRSGSVGASKVAVRAARRGRADVGLRLCVSTGDDAVHRVLVRQSADDSVPHRAPATAALEGSPGLVPAQGHFTTSTPDLFAEYVYRPLFAGGGLECAPAAAVSARAHPAVRALHRPDDPVAAHLETGLSHVDIYRACSRW